MMFLERETSTGAWLQWKQRKQKVDIQFVIRNISPQGLCNSDPPVLVCLVSLFSEKKNSPC